MVYIHFLQHNFWNLYCLIWVDFQDFPGPVVFFQENGKYRNKIPGLSRFSLTSKKPWLQENTLAIREDKYKCIEKARVSCLFNLMSAPYFARYESKEVGW